jgi:hypothetical protein
MSDHRVTLARIHLASWAAWASTVAAGVIASGGQTPIAIDDPADYAAFGIAFASCMALVSSAVAAKLDVGGMRASFGPLASAAAMLGGMLPAAWTLAWSRQSGLSGSRSAQRDAGPEPDGRE